MQPQRRDRGASDFLLDKIVEQEKKEAPTREAQAATRAGYLLTLPAQIAGYPVNRDTGEIEDHMGNYVMSIRTGTPVAEIEAELKDSEGGEYE